MTIVHPGIHPQLEWTSTLPENSNSGDYTFFIRQKLLASGIIWDTAVQGRGEQLSVFPIDSEVSTFELWAVSTASPSSAYLLDTTTLGVYLPSAAVTIRTEDPYLPIRRTRADRPIFVDLNVQNLISDPFVPETSKGVTLQRHVQSYGPTGTGSPLNRDLADLLSEAAITSNGMTTLSISVSAIPGMDRTKVRGEERFTILSLEGYQLPASIIDSQFVQIWPMATASISGVTERQDIGPRLPQLSFQLNDLYPSSTTWAQVYKGTPQPGIAGITIPGSSVVINGSVPVNRTITIEDYGAVFDADGTYTMELLTKTPFGTDRLAYLSFSVQRYTALEAWRQTHFGITSNIGNGADEIDYDGDGIANLIEFAFGLDPKQSSAGQLPVPERIDDQVIIRFTPPAGATGILHGAEWSSTLDSDSWLPLTNTGVAPEHVFSVPTSGNPQIFLRLKATAQ